MHLNEWLASLLQLRAKELEKGLINMLDDVDKVKELYYHPLIFGLWQSGENKKSTNTLSNPVLTSVQEVAVTASTVLALTKSIKRLPSYIPCQYLSHALLDCLPITTDSGQLVPNASEIINNKITNIQLKNTLLAMLKDSGNNLEKLHQNLESWFNHSMDRLSGAYKRKIQFYGLLVAAIVVVICNIDTIQIIDYLSKSSYTHAITTTVTSNFNENKELNEQVNLLMSMGLPIGWTNPHSFPKGDLACFNRILGWFISTIAISLGAPFWFDVLKNLTNVRFAGKNPKEN